MKCKGCGALLGFRDLPVLLHDKNFIVECPNCKSIIRLGMYMVVPLVEPNLYPVEVMEIE